MVIIEIFRQALLSLKGNKLRSFLTLIAIVVGVFAIISSSTAVLVIENYFDETLNVLGGSTVTISKYPGVNFGPRDRSLRNRKNITFDLYEQLDKRLGNAVMMGPDEDFSFTAIRYGEIETEPNISIRGVNQNWIELNGKDIELGRNFTSDDIQYGRAVCLIGEDIREKLFKNERSIGKTIRIDGLPYTVVGKVKSSGAIFGSSQDDFVVVPYTKALNVYGGATWRNISIDLKAPNIVELPALLDRLTGVLRAIRKVEPGDPNDFELITNDSISGAFDQFTGILYIFGIAVGSIALLGAGIGVMNIMLVSVTERTREIGVRKAVGAKRNTIVGQFLTESVFICQLGGIIGILFGVLGGNILAIQMDATVVFPWGAAIGGVIGMTLVGLAFGVLPALKAAKLDPVESLRYE